tara:strand:- start:16 stop:855 length:840 start_codon:yes stop_codon:yes gene_type:complete
MIKLVPVFLFFLLPALIAAIAVPVINRNHRHFVNPLTKSMRRPPGAQLGRQLGGEQMELGLGLLEIGMSSLAPIAVLFVYQDQLQETVPQIFLGLVIVGWVIWLIFAIRRFIKRIHRIKQLRLGYECELAVGQELDLLMLKGFRVFHDVPAENFNIDHIVIGPTGVFAVETKGRSKITSGNGDGKAQFRVAYKAGVLHFPNGADRDAVPQAKRQAKWVSQWLSQATGQRLQAQPVVILPGWFVESQEKPEVPVIASGYIDGFFSQRRNRVLARIFHKQG